jgi:hypothetical protein
VSVWKGASRTSPLPCICLRAHARERGTQAVSPAQCLAGHSCRAVSEQLLSTVQAGRLWALWYCGLALRPLR